MIEKFASDEKLLNALMSMLDRVKSLYGPYNVSQGGIYYR